MLHGTRLDAHFGGAEGNVAVALARLGWPSAMVSALPDDAIGDAAIESLRKAGVDTSRVARAPAGCTSRASSRRLGRRWPKSASPRLPPRARRTWASLSTAIFAGRCGV